MSARIICNVVKTLSVAAFGVAGYWSMRLAFADSQFRANTSTSVARAAELDPANASYHAWLAEIREYEGHDPDVELEIASRLNPSASALWIRRALLAESRRDFPRAEQLYLQAARIDRLYAPRWALANYYARVGDAGKFWPWARQSLEIGYGDLSPLFRLCWSVTGDSELIRSKAIPQQAAILRKYLAFLIQQGHLDAAQPIAQSLIAQAGAADTPVLLQYCDRLIERQLSPAAVSVWNSMSQRGVFALPSLAPDRGIALTNGNFQTEPMQQAFDWRTSVEPGISVARSESPAALRFFLSGTQPEHCELLSQFVPLGARREYRFRVEYKSALGTHSGLRWRVGKLAQSDELSRTDWTWQQLTFPSGTSSLERLTLGYDREPGAVRAEGEIWLRNATIELVK
jgi:tetratricopeptide (TPR) repeat protein